MLRSRSWSKSFTMKECRMRGNSELNSSHASGESLQWTERSRNLLWSLQTSSLDKIFLRWYQVVAVAVAVEEEESLMLLPVLSSFPS